MSGKHKRRQQAQPKKGKFLPIVLTGVMIILIAGAVSAWLLTRESAFEKAVRKPELRQEYIDNVILEIGKPEKLVEINYVDANESIDFFGDEADMIMNITVLQESSFLDYGKKDLFLRLDIFPVAFELVTIKTEKDFKSTLAHEFRHAAAMASGKIGRFQIADFYLPHEEQNENLVRSIVELDALKPQLQDDISKDYWASVRMLYLLFYANLWRYSEGLDKEILFNLKFDFFEPKAFYLSQAELNNQRSLAIKIEGQMIEIPPEIFKRKLTQKQLG